MNILRKKISYHLGDWNVGRVWVNMSKENFPLWLPAIYNAKNTGTSCRQDRLLRKQV